MASVMNGMRVLFDEDWKDYKPGWAHNSRMTARGIIIMNNKILLGHFGQGGFYVFPGGGVEPNERLIDALIRETKEETGYDVIRSSVKPFGMTKMVKADYSAPDTIFTGLSYYFFAQVDDTHQAAPDLTDSEKRRKMDNRWIDIADIPKLIKTNQDSMKRMKSSLDDGVDQNGFPLIRRYDYIYRETKVLQILAKELRLVV